MNGSPGCSSSAFWISVARLGQAHLAIGERVAERVVGVLVVGLERDHAAQQALHLVEAVELLGRSSPARRAGRCRRGSALFACASTCSASAHCLRSRSSCASASSLARASSGRARARVRISSRASSILPWRASSDARRACTSSARCGLSMRASQRSAPAKSCAARPPAPAAGRPASAPCSRRAACRRRRRRRRCGGRGAPSRPLRRLDQADVVASAPPSASRGSLQLELERAEREPGRRQLRVALRQRPRAAARRFGVALRRRQRAHVEPAARRARPCAPRR